MFPNHYGCLQKLLDSKVFKVYYPDKIMKKTKKQAEKEINDFFKNIKNKSKEEIRKIKRLAMHYNIKLGKKRKDFCQECYSNNLKVLSIKNSIKRVKCQGCGKIYRWKIKN